MRASCQKRQIRLVSTLYGIANRIKNGTIRKNVPPAYNRSVALNYFRTGLKILFRNENSTLEIHVSLFGVLHWQQLQPSASAPDNNLKH